MKVPPEGCAKPDSVEEKNGEYHHCALIAGVALGHHYCTDPPITNEIKAMRNILAWSEKDPSQLSSRHVWDALRFMIGPTNFHKCPCFDVFPFRLIMGSDILPRIKKAGLLPDYMERYVPA